MPNDLFGDLLDDDFDDALDYFLFEETTKKKDDWDWDSDDDDYDDSNSGVAKHSCNKCGVAYNDDEIFCGKCDNKLGEVKVMFCGKCGKQIKEGNSFCTGCGVQLENKEDESTNVTNIANSNANILNGGYYACSESEVFYSNIDDEGKLYEMNLNGTNKTKLSDIRTWCITIMNNWVFYCNNGLYKTHCQGGLSLQLIEEEGRIIGTTESQVYYLSGKKLYKFNMDNNDKVEIVSGYLKSPQICGDKIYFIDEDDYRCDCDDDAFECECNSYYLYEMNTASFEKRKTGCLIENNPFLVVDNYVYQFTDEGMHKTKADGSECKKLSNDKSFGDINISRNILYYRNSEDNCNIYKICTDGSNRTKLSDFEKNLEPCNLHLICNSVYYRIRRVTYEDDVYCSELIGDGKISI